MAKEAIQEGRILFQGRCLRPDCGSSDAATRYSNGWIKCYSCGKNYPDPEQNSAVANPSFPKRPQGSGKRPFINGECVALPARDISIDTCKAHRYMLGKVPTNYPAPDDSPIGRMKGQTVHIENYYVNGELVGQKLRDKDKNFAIIGKISELLWGQDTIPKGGKLIVVTEGAIDALSYMEVRKGWYAVSIPNGVESASKAIKANLDFLEAFDTVVFAFDNDAVGREGLTKCQFLLTPGKVKIAKLAAPYKDFNDALTAGDPKAILNSIFQAEEVRPDGIVGIDEVLQEALKPVEWGLPWFLDELTQLTYGRRFGEVYTLGAGTGIGKTDFFLEQCAYDTQQLGLHIGILFLEQKPSETVKRLAGKDAGKQFHIPDAGWTKEELVQAVSKFSNKVTFYDSFGETEWANVKQRIRHMAIAKGIKVFYVDHLTAMADTADEKGSLEQIMKEIAGLANELGLIIHLISHLTTPEKGRPHEEGGRVTIRHFKGSRSIGFWSYYMFGLERDQQAEDPEERTITTLRVLKDRYSGQATGATIRLGFDAVAGRLIPMNLKSMSAAQLRKEADKF